MIIAPIIIASMLKSEPDLTQLTRQVDPARMKATIEKLSSFNTRNTSSPELKEAAEWIAGEYRKIPGMQVEIMTYTIQAGPRVPQNKDVVEVVAKLPGADDRMVLVGGHMDSINMQADASGHLPDVFTARAPGANDDGSGASLALELGRVMAGQHWQHTLVFCAFSGEEQGLFGSAALAARAKSEGWKLDAVLSNDMVGNSHDTQKEINSRQVRLFSDDPDKTGKNPQNDRELARYIELKTRGLVHNHSVKLVFRGDRFGRGGDHTSFSNAGFSAVRFTDFYEEYARQHTPLDLPEAVDFNYLANNARLNLIAMACLANAGESPTDVRITVHLDHDSTVHWKSTPGTKYVVYWRDTASPGWEHSQEVGAVDHVTLPGVSKDDNFIAVGAEGGIPVPVSSGRRPG
jgi:hypothetical protein